MSTSIQELGQKYSLWSFGQSDAPGIGEYLIRLKLQRTKYGGRFEVGPKNGIMRKRNK